MINVNQSDILQFIYFIKISKVSKIIDGDTIILICDKGKREWDEETYRLYGINCPEKRKSSMESYKAAKSYLTELIKDGGQLYINTIKNESDSFGRWLAILYNERGECINQMMIDGGHAIKFNPK